NHAGAQHQAVRNDLRLRRRLLEERQEIAGKAHEGIRMYGTDLLTETGRSGQCERPRRTRPRCLDVAASTARTFRFIARREVPRVVLATATKSTAGGIRWISTHSSNR